MLRLRDGCGGDEGVGEDARRAELGGDAARDVAVLALDVPESKMMIEELMTVVENYGKSNTSA